MNETFGVFLVICSILAAAGVVYLFPLPKEDKKISVLYGYPKYGRTWLTIYHRRSTGEWIFEKDDLFAEKRPLSWGSLDADLMFPDRTSGATQEEFDKARAMLYRTPH